MAIPKNLLPASLMKKPKTFEEFQEFFFYWEPNMPFTEHSYAKDDDGYQYAKEDVKEFKLILWNARKIKNLTKSEIHRIYALYRGYNCFVVWASGTRSKLHRMTAKEIKEEKSLGYDEDYINYKGWKDSDNPKDPQIKKD